MWDERYSDPDYFYGKEPNDFLKESVHLLRAHNKILCLAEGEGRNAVFLAGLGLNLDVTALDASRVGLNKTLALAQERSVSVQTIHADLADYELGENCWDVIVSVWCHLPSNLRRKVHTGIVQALKPGGRLILEAYTPAQLKFQSGGPKSVDMLMQLDDLKNELSGLKILVGQECERTIHEGLGHNGLSAVVQLTAIKEQ
ncbi:class I SAM-dependent methyltransferase [bacterium]|nr:class I SAM-dependent methyltransferase [bacterium]